MKVCHFTSVHPRDDIRIFRKQCRTLAQAGYDVVLVVADGLGSGEANGVRIVDVGRPSGGRVSRMLGTTRRVLSAAQQENADIYQFHDPELIPAGLQLLKSGKRVVFDSHEDFAADIRTKAYLHPLVRRSVSVAFSTYELFVCRQLTHIIAATPAIRDHFRSRGCRTTDINNYPFVDELGGVGQVQRRAGSVAYVGGITAIRGFPEVVDAMDQVDSGISMQLAGVFAETQTEALCRARPGWQRVNYRGHVDRTAVAGILAEAIAGIVTFLPAPNHVDSQPNKMFEYMSAGLPVIASDFPLWKRIIEGNDCGLCVDPTKPESMAAAINRLAGDPDLVRIMGSRGREAVIRKYNWESESKRLLSLYAELLAENARVR